MPSKKKPKPDYSKAPLESQRRMGRYLPLQQEIEQPQPKSKLHPIVQPFALIEKRLWEPMLSWGEN